MNEMPLAQADEVVVSVNPKAGARSSADRVARLAESLSSRGITPHVLTSLDAVGELSNRLHAEGKLRALVAVGGDGTAAELVNRTAVGLPLALLPSGNENLLARFLGISGSPDDLVEAIVRRQVVELDAGRANGRLFLLMLGCGFDGEVVKRVHSRRTGHIRTRNYVKPIFEVLRSYDYPALKVRLDDRDASDPAEIPMELRWLFVFNLPCYGGGLRIAPGACGTDGRLDVCGFRRGGIVNGLAYAAAVACRRHHRSRDWQIAAATRMTITAETPVHYQLDGDPGGTLPVEVEALPGRLTLVVPPNGKMMQSQG